MRRLIWGFAGRTYHIFGNLMHWLILYFLYNIIWMIACDPMIYNKGHLKFIASNQKEEII